MSGLEGDETVGEGRNEYLLSRIVDIFGDIPLAHVAVELVGVVEHCEEREGARVRLRRRRDSGGRWTYCETCQTPLRHPTRSRR